MTLALNSHRRRHLIQVLAYMSPYTGLYSSPYRGANQEK